MLNKEKVDQLVSLNFLKSKPVITIDLGVLTPGEKNQSLKGGSLSEKLFNL